MAPPVFALRLNGKPEVFRRRPVEDMLVELDYAKILVLVQHVAGHLGSLPKQPDLLKDG
jgi:hypothetical protein